MYAGDAVEIGVKPTPICSVGPTGALLQHLGGVPVTIGGPEVKAGRGLLLRETDGLLPVPGGYSSPANIGESAEPLTLYGVRGDEGTARVAYLKHDLPAS